MEREHGMSYRQHSAGTAEFASPTMAPTVNGRGHSAQGEVRAWTVRATTDGEPPPGVTGTDPVRQDCILLVDDEEPVRFVIALLLRRRGFDVLEARDGIDALLAVRTTVPDVVLSDLNMPRCDGEQLCCALKLDASTAHIPFILMTGADVDDKRMRAAGCAEVLHKPLPASFADVVIAVLRSSRRSSARAAG
jgi:CheY-like chemotaxis protein